MKREEFAARRRAMGDKPIEDLIDALASDELETRFFAEMCLRDATST